MIKRLFSLIVALCLSPLPAFAAVTAGSNVKTTRANGAPAGALSAPGLGSAPLLSAPAAGLTPSLTVAPAPALAAIALAETGTAESIRALTAETSPAAAFVKAVVAQPHTLADAAVRAEAVAALGEPAVARLEAAARALAPSAELTQLRREVGVVTPAVAQRALARLIKEFGTMSAVPETTPVVAAAPKPARRPSALRRYAMAALAVMTLSNAVPAISVASEHAQPASVRIVLADQLGSLLAQAGQQQADYVQFRTADELVAQWNPDQHLYVSGDVGLDRAALRRLSAFLADKHWTVVLVADSSGFRWRDAQGNTRYGDDAIEYATGQGIFAKGGFTSQTNSVTGQRDGSILTFIMQQRVLLLRNSEAQKSVGLNGETRFKGHLDQWAVSNMRNGGDVYGAVTETVDNVDRLLASAIASAQQSAVGSIAEAKSTLSQYEASRAAFVAKHPSASVGKADVAAARRGIAEAEAQLAKKQTSLAAKTASDAVSSVSAAVDQMASYDRSFTSASERLSAAKTELDALDKAATAYRSAHPGAAGDLARPDVTGWRETLASAEKQKVSNPQSASASAERVLSEVRAVSAALAQHPAGAALIAETQQLHDSLASRLRSGEGQTSLTAAQQSLRDAREAHNAGSSKWSASLQSAKASLAQAEQAIDAADAAAKTKLMIFWLSMILGSLFTLGAAIWLNRRAARASAKAELALQKWDKILETKVEAIFGKPDDAVNNLETKITTYVGPEAGEGARGWIGETSTVAAQIRKDSGYAKLLLDKAREVHTEATALVRPAMGPRWVFNLFWPSNFALAEAKLSTAKITFKPGDPTAGVSGQKRDWRADLYGDSKDYEPFSLSFDELIAMFNARAKAAVDSLDKLEYAVTQSGAVFNALEGKIAEAAKSKDSLAGAADGLFAVSALFEKALPAASEQVAASRVTAQKDPIKGIYGGGAEATRIVEDATALVSALTAARAKALSVADASAKSIVADSVEAGWIADDKKKLSAKADKIAADAATKPVAARVAALAAELNALAAKADDIAKGAQALTKLRAGVNKIETSVSDARAKIGTALGLDAAQMLTEKGSNPTEFIADARDLAEQTDVLLGQGKLAEAKDVFAKAENAARGATEIVSVGLRSLETHAAVEQQRRAETERLTSLVPGAKRVLASIEKDFAPSVLALNAGDASHPSANGTVKDNVDEAEAAIEAATSKREKALRAFTEGKVILAFELLSQVAAHQAVAQHRVTEIDEKRARLDAAVAANKAARDAQEARVRDFKTKVEGDRRTMKPTLKALESAKKDLAAAAEQIEAAKGDPFKAAAALAAATATLEQVWVSARNDFDAYAEVERSLQAAYKQLGTARELAQRAGNDNTADSPAITSAVRELDQLENAYRSAVEAAKASHGDWNALDREADRVTNAASHVAATLNGELAAAAAATSAISSAASKVREATNWSGSYGVYISGSPGGNALENARQALNRGDYDGAKRYAESARREAASAISNAEAEVERHREEERRRRAAEEAARRRREQEEEDRRRRSSSSSGSSSNWGSSSSGSGGSSWGGSSSGSGKSGW